MSIAASGTSPSITKVISAASTNSTLVRAGHVQVVGYGFSNQHATAWAWLKLYNKATAPTVGTDTPVYTLGLPPLGSGHISFDENIAFALGLGLGITGDEADSDTTATGAGDVVVNLFWA